MKRSQRLLLMFLALAAAVALYWGAARLAPQEAQDSQLAVLGGEAVTAMKWNCVGEEISLLLTDGVWRVEGDEAFPLSQVEAGEYAQMLSTLTAARAIEQAQDAAEYGLEPPSFSMTVALEGGAQVELCMGAQNPMTGEYYLLRRDNGVVYAVEASLADLFDCAQVDLAQLAELLYPARAARVIIGDFVALSRDDQGAWRDEQGAALDEIAVEALVDAVRVLQPVALADWKGAATLEDPIRVTLLDEAGAGVTLLLGVPDALSGDCLAQIPGSPLVYRVYAAQAEIVRNIRMDDLRAG